MELPDAEKIRRELSHRVINKKITDFIADENILHGDNAKIIQSYVEDIKRHGALIIFKLASGYYLLANLYSTGNLIWSKQELEDKSIKARFKFADDSWMYFIRPGRFGYLQVLSDTEIKRLAVKFGLDPTAKDFSFLDFYKLLRNKTSSVKDFLMNEGYLAGVGKIYAGQICSLARVEQDKKVNFLEQAEIKRLYTAIRKIFNAFSHLKI